MPSTSRAMPSRSCKKKILYDEEFEETEAPNLNESTKNSTQKYVSDSIDEDDEDKEDLNEKIEKKFSEFKTLKAEWEDDMKKACKHKTVYFVQTEEMIQRFLDTWSSDKYEQLLTFVVGKLGELQRFLAIRGISSINPNTLPHFSIRQSSSNSDE